MLSGVEAFAQQDAQYSQYMFNQLALNPACAGSREVLATSLTYRDQWTGIQGAPTTGAFSIQMPMKRKKIGLGLEILSDKQGPRNTSAALLSYAYRVAFLKGKLAFGLRMGVYDYVFDWSKMDYKDLNDIYYVNNSSTRTSKITGTGDFGFYYYTRTFYWGLGMTHLNRGKISDLDVSDSSARQAFHFFMPVSKAFEVGNTVINPTLLIKGASNAPSEIDLGCNFLLKNRLWLGFSLRSGYGMVLLSQFQITDKMRVGYSYDLGRNKIGHEGKGSHEIMIGYDINILGTKTLTPRYL
jgi:type IX secretion system PorP/SprF family membrane protein